VEPDDDTFGTWMSGYTEWDPASFVVMDDLYKSYCQYVERWGEAAYSRRTFADIIEEHGYPRQRIARVNGFRGLRFKARDLAGLRVGAPDVE
jgi:hypothetical protein